MTFISENEFAAGTLAKFAGQLGQHAAGIAGAIANFLRLHGERLIGLAAFLFGVYRWWVYRESLLRKRLEKYLKESDKRLHEGQDYVLNALQRPGPGQKFKEPLFADQPLRSVLRERNWDRTPVALTVESSADWQLEKARKAIENRLSDAEKSIASLRQQLATTHILRGAIASSAARRDPSRVTEKNNLALTFFRTALLVPDHRQNVVAKEFEAHQLRRLGHLQDALAAYEEVEENAQSIADHRERSLMIARAKRYQAEIDQVLASVQLADGTRDFNGRLVAFGLLNPAALNSALDIRAQFAPFQGWDLLEQGDIHYLTAFVAHNLGFVHVENTQLNNAYTSYSGAIAALPRRLMWQPRSERSLREIAQTGSDRADRAQQQNGNYDLAWLLPPLK